MDLLAQVAEGSARNSVPLFFPVVAAQHMQHIPQMQPMLVYQMPVGGVYQQHGAVQMNAQALAHTQLAQLGIQQQLLSSPPMVLAPTMQPGAKRPRADANRSKRVVWRNFAEALIFTHHLKLKSAAEWKVRHTHSFFFFSMKKIFYAFFCRRF